MCKKANFDELVDVDSEGFQAIVPVVLFGEARDCRSCLLLEVCSLVVVVRRSPAFDRDCAPPGVEGFELCSRVVTLVLRVIRPSGKDAGKERVLVAAETTDAQLWAATVRLPDRNCDPSVAANWDAFSFESESSTKDRSGIVELGKSGFQLGIVAREVFPTLSLKPKPKSTDASAATRTARCFPILRSRIKYKCS